MNHPLAVTIGGILTLLANCGAVESQSPGEYSALTVSNIAAHIRLQAETTSPLVMNSYTNSIPDSRATYSMVAIPGGEFVMGNSIGGQNYKPDQSPPHRVKLEPFWIGKYEVTWNEFNSFMLDDIDRRQYSPPQSSGKLESGQTDAITHPSLPFVDMSFGMGKSGYPAIGMTQHAANKYCQWLSAKTGHFYRLPTEAEWEYAARSGSTNTWFFGDSPSKLSDYAWFEDNSDMKYQKVGRKLPNAWGLHDVLGNVSEWVLDQYDEVFYRRCAEEGTAFMPWNRASKQYPHSVRGGSWRDPIQEVHCAVRGQSTPNWKMGDPQMPRSLFWLRNCDFVGFRIVRPRQLPTTEQMGQYWNSGVESE